ncbi:hypothetical protein ACQPUY_08015 [Clostridium nigeriense]|uniref:hypothetical protein n=1 Tax=Clostridium nigeriense TaxID=1805470 RepID=UPI003D350EBF
MKKLLVYFSLIIFSIILIVGCSENSRNYMTGIYLRSNNGINIIVSDDSGPTVMSNKTGNENIFDDLKSGDKIEITYDSIMETYPGKTQIYSCTFIERGSINDIPKDTLDKLQEMGWTFDLENS